VLAAGDFNFDITGDREVSALQDAGFENPFASLGMPTVVSGSFGRHSFIDWVLVRGGVTAVSPEVHNSIGGSDHYPLSLTLRFR
jgi:endonuclease/exonuclease/phosphatase family metal-dependent hydrolase